MLKVLELFAGIGACSKALERLGIEHEIVDAVEIDKYAIASFNAIHNTDFKPQDITEWDKDIEVDLIMHGSPCQDFSIAGRQAGGNKDSGTRSSLIYETIRIVKKLKPRYVIFENVKNLLSKKHKHNFDAYLEEMEQLGYKNHCQVLCALDYSMPQNRERVYVVSVLNDSAFEFPKKQELKLKLKDMLEAEVDEKYYLSNDIVKTYTEISNTGNVIGKLNMNKWQDRMKRIYNIETYAPAITTMQGGYLEPKIKTDKGIRKLTPKECWRLMGFNDTDFEKAEKVNSNTQLYKQAGNSIVVNVLKAILKNLLK